MPKPPHLAHFNTEQWLYFELPLDLLATQRITEAELSQSYGENEFRLLICVIWFIGHYLKLLTIGEGWSVDCLLAQLPIYHDVPVQCPHYCWRHTKPPVQVTLHFPVIREQHPEKVFLLAQELTKHRRGQPTNRYASSAKSRDSPNCWHSRKNYNYNTIWGERWVGVGNGKDNVWAGKICRKTCWCWNK